MVNPYAAPSDVSATIPPIRFGFGQKLTLEDLQVSLRDTAPRKGLNRFQLPIVGILVLYILLVLSSATDPSNASEPAPAIVWMLMGVAVCPFWIWLVGRFGPQRRKRVQRIRKMAEDPKANDGLITNDCLFDFDNDTASRCEWSHFGRSHIFPQHLVLIVAADSNRRFVIPWRFFASPAEVRQVCQHVADRLGVSANQPPTDKELAEIFQQRELEPLDPEPIWPIADPCRFDKDHWPHVNKNNDVDAADQFDCEVDLSGDLSLWKYTGIASALIAAYLLWVFLPIWIAVATWLALNYQHFGNWSFLVQRRWSSVVVLVPVVGLLYVFLKAAVDSLLQNRSRQSQRLTMRIRRSGIHFAGPTFETWFATAAFSKWNVNENSVGWTLKETGEEILIPASCFKDATEFKRLSEAIQSELPMSHDSLER
ncbi:MAG: hypothetical protein WBD20_18250 [Pirellulaceae bacterium]